MRSTSRAASRGSRPRGRRSAPASSARGSPGTTARRTDDAFRGWCDVWLAPVFEHWSIEAELAGIRAPLLVVQGRDDPYGTLRQVEAIAHRTGGPCETLVLDDCGHSPHRDRMRATTAAVVRFAARLE